MKRFVAGVGISVLLAGSAIAGPEGIIKQRAKDVRDQNNARQSVPPSQPPPPQQPAPAPARAPAQPAVRAVPGMPQQGIAKIQADLAGMRGKAQIAPEQTQQLARDLSAAAQGATRPSSSAVAKFANDLTAALAGKNLPATAESRLAQNIHAVLNSAAIPASQMQAIVEDVQSVLQKNGVARAEATAATHSLKVIAAEVRKPASK
jgi:hypothetical protein